MDNRGKKSGSSALPVSDGRRGPQRRAVRKDGWTAKRRALFLETLAETANVRESARVAGVGKTCAYYYRQRDPGFARAWAQALDVAFDELGTLLLRQALFGTEQVEITEDEKGAVKARKVKREIPLMLAHRLLQDHRAEVMQVRALRAEDGPDTSSARSQLEEVLARLRSEEEESL
ncbi:hypothetical protein [Sphingobium aromaticiconvertens]|uniref:hypothetical protein n=1 Tax=Sphingobium aromaticiconvertens TaxID=365341 RepID=UPI003018360E